MEDQGQEHGMERNNEPVRSRWTPKPEQIVILESIFNSGMVNPPKDETVRIRKLLEPYGSVGDANVFYWFQNRRSRSRRRQRQIQASLAGDRAAQAHAAGAIQYQSNLMPPSAFVPSSSAAASCLHGASSSSPSSCGGGSGLSEDAVDHLFSFSPQMGTTSLQDMEHISGVTSTLCPSNTSNLHYQSGYVTVFINGVPTEVPKGSFDMKGMFGQEFMLVHSSGVPVPFNEFGFSVQSLQHGESYFLVSITFKLILKPAIYLCTHQQELPLSGFKIL